MSESVRVFVNAVGMDLPRGATALDAVRAWKAAEAEAVAAGNRVITDSRGLPLDTATVLAAGTILRTISGRGGEAGDADPAVVS